MPAYFFFDQNAKPKHRLIGPLFFILYFILVFSLSSAQQKHWTVVIDPGHGGNDYGVKSPGGVFEKDIDLMTANSVKEALDSYPQIKAMMTRNNDVFLSISNRAIISNRLKPDLFISIHCAYSPRKSDHGFIVYYYKPDDRELSQYNAIKDTIDGKDIALVPWQMAQLAFVPESKKLATTIDEDLSTFLHLPSRAIVGEHLKLLSQIKCPAVLIEVCFLSNVDDEKNLMDAKYRIGIAKQIATTLDNFLQKASLFDGGGN